MNLSINLSAVQSPRDSPRSHRPLSPAERIKSSREQHTLNTSRSSNAGPDAASNLNALGHLLGGSVSAEFVVGDWKLGKVLGKGAFGTTRIATHASGEHASVVAVKCYDKKMVAR
jgi:hypothetical protein